MKSWLSIPEKSDFSINNIPFGIAKTTQGFAAFTRIGDYAINLKELNREKEFSALGVPEYVLSEPYLNNFIGLGKEKTKAFRLAVQAFFSNESNKDRLNESILPAESVQMTLPVYTRDYTDFYSSIEHATNVGKMFRDPENALLPNWRHLPVGYHGRASSIVVSGVPLHRPKGQLKPNDGDPIFGASKLLDFELEMGCIIGKENKLGKPVPTTEAQDYLFGMVLFNDWSARDIQKWEYVPLGPFLGKNFGSSMSPWIVTMEALDYLRVSGPEQEPAVLPYLKSEGKQNYDINLSVSIKPEGQEESIVSKSNYKYMYWNLLQQLAHHTINGCNMQIGDLIASGTISGKSPDSYGSMLELSWGGKHEVPLKNGATRKFIQDNDTVIVRGHGEKDGIRVGFGEVSCKILPAHES